MTELGNSFDNFAKDATTQTPLLNLIFLLVALWLVFAAGFYFAEHEIEGASITSCGRALYWGIAAFSTAGIADEPVSGTARFIGGLWIVVGSMLFFGTIVATVTAYFMRPLQRPARQIIDTIETTWNVWRTCRWKSLICSRGRSTR
jgi:voltage-gated potassium channel